MFYTNSFLFYTPMQNLRNCFCFLLESSTQTRSDFRSHNYFDIYCRNPHFLILQIYNNRFLWQILGINFPIISGLSRYKIRYFWFIFVPHSIIFFDKFIKIGKINFFKNQRISLYFFRLFLWRLLDLFSLFFRDFSLIQNCVIHQIHFCQNYQRKNGQKILSIIIFLFRVSQKEKKDFFLFS